MERSTEYKDYWWCRGEVFYIRAIDQTDGNILTCSRAGILYSYTKGQYWWLSTNKKWVRNVDTKTCPGDSASSMRHGGCSWEAWRIYVFDKPCGVPVQDRDRVRLINEHNGRAPLSPSPSVSFPYARWDVIPDKKYTEDGRELRWYIPDFIIFRSDVDRGEYRRDLPCS